MSSGTFWKFNQKNLAWSIAGVHCDSAGHTPFDSCSALFRLDGIGVEFGEEGLLEYCHLQVIAAKR